MKKKIFIDTNIFIRLLLDEVKSESISNFMDNTNASYYTNTVVLNELRYLLLYQQASEIIKSTKKYNIMNFIKKNFDFRKEVLSKYLAFYNNLKEIVKIVDVLKEDETDICLISVNEGLLPSDASILNSMRKNNIKNIFTDDSDFKKIKGLKIIEI